MATGWRYRVASVVGTLFLSATTVTLVNSPPVQNGFARLPYLGGPAPAVLSNGELSVASVTTIVVVLAAMWPVFKPRPRRILDTILLTQKRLVLAMLVLASLGYFDYTYRLPRPTLLLTTGVLLAVLPLWTVAIRRRPSATERAVIVGDDPETMADLLRSVEMPVVGYVSPPSSYAVTGASPAERVEVADGGHAVENRLDDLPYLGGFARLEEILVEHDPDTALLAFESANREEFFGTLHVCADHGISALAHRDHADDVLTANVAGGDLVTVDLEPWDWQDYAVKRVFDFAFAATGLLVLSPIIAAVAVAIKLDSPGPLLYSQARTAAFGDTFSVYKFRSMVPDAEAETGATLSAEDRGGEDPRVTRVGRVLRQTHLDEIPQLWSILVGDMSVVGPRPERPELDADIERGVGEWRRRWFVKPGLTGLAQIRGATGHDPAEKLRHDIEYIRRQSLWFDLKIVIRQLWDVLGDAVAMIRTRRRS